MQPHLAPHRPSAGVRPPAPALTLLLAAVLALTGLDVRTAGAQWSASPATGTAFCKADGDQWPLAQIGDDAGGAIVAWIDGRGGITANGVWAQRLDAFGRAMWATNGVSLVANTSVAQTLGVAADGAGGILVTWSESRGGASPAVYVQRLDANGVALWTTGGVLVAASPNAQQRPVVVSDGAGGAVVAWQDAGGDSEVVARRIDSGGAPQWGGAVMLSAAGTRDVRPRIASDGAGGAIVAWTSGDGLAVRRVDASGVALWPGGYRRTAVTPTDLQADGQGGALVAWTRARTVGSTTQQDVMVQRLDANGLESWLAGGIVLDTTAKVFSIRLLADGTGGAFAAWEHASAAASLVRAQRVGSGGAIAWAPGGVAMCPLGVGQYWPRLTTDGADGVITVFEDTRAAGRPDVWAQRLSGAGALQWGGAGVAVCTALGSGVGEACLVHGLGASAIVAWDDFRALEYESDLYATRLVSTGGMGPTAVGAPAMAARLALAPPYPQPARGEAWFRYRSAESGDARFELFDVSGRRVRALDVAIAPGEGAFRLPLGDAGGDGLASGAYTARLTLGAEVAGTVIVVVR